MKIGNVATRKKVTGRLFFQPVGEPFADLGNVTLVKHEPKIDRAQQLSFSKGRSQVTHEEPGKIDYRWSIKCDERVGATLQLLTLAREVLTTDLTHLTADGGDLLHAGDMVDMEHPYVTNVIWFGDNGDNEADPVENVDYAVNYVTGKITILTNYFENGVSSQWRFDVLAQAEKNGVTHDLGFGVLAGEIKSYALGAFNISNFSIQDQETAEFLVAGRDYTVDLKAGMVTLIGYGSVGGLLAIWDQPAIEVKSYTLLSDAFVRGTAKLILQDQSSTVSALAPKEVATFAAEINTSDWGDNDGTKFNEFQLALLATGAPTVLSRES